MQIEYGIFGPILSHKSPLMYPGGKTKAWKRLQHYIPNNITTLVSPFMGGGAVELKCAALGAKVSASDILEPLVNFWQCFIEDSNQVMDIVNSKVPLSYEERYHYYETELKPDQKGFDGSFLDNVNRAAIFFILNRQNFRGWTLLAPPTKSYFLNNLTDSILKSYENWYNPNITVIHSDYRPVLELVKSDDFVYADPPYVGKEHFYGTKDSVKEFDHLEFKERMISLPCKWIISYIKHDLIMDLYKDYQIIEYQHKPTIVDVKSKANTELFIMNY